MDNGFTPKGLVRIREDSITDLSGPQPKPKPQHPSQIAKFSTESLHSFSFSSTNDPDMMEARVSIITRSIDFMKQKIKGWKIPDAAFQYLPQSPTNTMTVMEKYGWPTSWSTANTPRSSMDLTDEPLEEHLQQHERASTNESEASDSTVSTEDSSRSSRSSTPTTASTWKPPSPKPDRRKNAKLKRTLTDIPTIHNSGGYGLSSLPHRNESLLQHPTPLGRSLHSPTRFLPQNQAMLTSNAAWQVSLVNDIACLVFGYERRDLMGMSTLELIALPFRERHEELMRKRKEELAQGGGRAGGRAEDDERGVVLVCGKVVGE
ncbi:hypothetical protein BC937DRAFT_87927 [Endogone sp. FLAS-F59071]|nr:hypothetical protein BC937DRAFT_87927 [Endogone sp. FLAS-F59071]|eukprot:RUS12435.1 hypothetical protein BC937DRAFT_87927 [Endogone sp. FLAS-F59071]